AAKEFETELKKDPEPSGEEPKITTASEEKQQEDAKVSSTKESS
ncbi:hypothetical protein MIMGU_mgv1a0158102mg, partial [Erythranthe guttata]